MTAFRRTRLVVQLAFSNLHEWFPAPNSGPASYHGFHETLQQAGISRIAFLRHGNTASASNGVDFDRVLTELGRSQAREAGSSFGRDLRPFFPEMMVSPAPRAVETAALLLEESEDEETKIEQIPVLYDGTMQPLGSQLFRKVGYAPLRHYLNSDDEDDRGAAQEVLGAYAHNALGVMSESISSSSHPCRGATLWMVGHAIYLPAAALGLAFLLGCDEASQDLILSTNTREAEGYLVEASPPHARLLIRPSNDE